MRHHFIFYASLCALILGFFNCSNHPDEKAVRTNKSLKNEPEISDLKKYLKEKHISSASLTILIDKSDKKLYVMHSGSLLKAYPVALGSTSLADKRMQGDNLTPEGDFLIQAKYPHKSWKYFMWLNYPTPDSRNKHNLAKAAGLIPKTASIGGEIGIHGVVEGSDYLVSGGIPWTKGCISLKNSHIAELYAIVGSNSTIIRIQK